MEQQQQAGEEESEENRKNWEDEEESVAEKTTKENSRSLRKVQKVMADEVKALHLADIQEATATAHVTEILADIQPHMDRLG
ncbi:Tripartite motif-containing protein 44 [Fukomys damarensis]|uniref:Tripartite motif-containing protein 44 n=1 Tax=Fukomys damarensis TaxID=885580 RepID=A0A091E648_FUKDA|nr:Tripartite motif-containing protein 44 [Fukomys damarensis]